jgi:hypothetical protein
LVAIITGLAAIGVTLKWQEIKCFYLPGNSLSASTHRPSWHLWNAASVVCFLLLAEIIIANWPSHPLTDFDFSGLMIVPLTLLVQCQGKGIE